MRVGPGADGIGKLVEIRGDQAEIEYFESPVGPKMRRIVAPSSSVQSVELPAQTRVFWQDLKTSAWHVGRVDGGLVAAAAIRATEDHYHVRFPNQQDTRVPISRLYVRWNHPIEEPTDYLAHRILETPFFFDGRSAIVRHISEQRNSFGGLTGLASAAIDLLEHQVTIVRKVLSDPVERYLLADEVGLGKTVEAGVLIRQHLIDLPTGRALIVVPRHLTRQWKSELATKFFLESGNELTSTARVLVVAEEQIVTAQIKHGVFSMLVVDEAHRSALLAFDADLSKRRLYETLTRLATAIPRVFLLSGTPVLHQEDGFLAMLHLLDPTAFPLEERDAFKRRARDRQLVAEAIADLHDESSAYFVEEVVRRLAEFGGEDPRLVALVAAVVPFVERDPSDVERQHAVRHLRVHLTETYRLHRRLLRTRRDDRRVRDLLPSRSGVTVLEHEDPPRAETSEFLKEWRSSALSHASEPSQEATRLFALFVESALSDPRVLLRSLQIRLRILTEGMVDSEPSAGLLASAEAFPDEVSLLRERERLIRTALTEEGRPHRLTTWLDSNASVRKVIVFVDDHQVADHLAEHIGRLQGIDSVVREDGSGEGVRQFEHGPVRVLVCDSKSEEGLNLQRLRAWIVHFDLPLEPARVEQRIGRIDRLEARAGMKALTFVSDCRYERGWLSCIRDTIKVFDRSVAPLQYLLVASTQALRKALLLDGVDAFHRLSAHLADTSSGLEAELKRIRAQESLDAIEDRPEQHQAFFEELQDADDRAGDDGESAVKSWLVDRLQFRIRSAPSGILRLVYDLNPKQPTLIPLLDTYQRFGGCIDNAPIAGLSRTEMPLRPFTLDRATAQSEGVELLRVGHPFLDSVEAHVREDDRGTAFALWRHLPSLNATKVFFRFDFLMEADVRGAETLIAADHSASALRRRGDYGLPVEYRTVWLNSDLKPIRNDRLIEALQRPYSKIRRADGSADVHLRHDRWPSVDVLPELLYWDELCFRARREAERILRESADFETYCVGRAADYRAASALAQERLQSRISRLAGAAREAELLVARFEEALAVELAAGIESPSLRADSAGAVVLSNVRLEVQ